MSALPDAPWIRDAETNGIYSPSPPRCPLCGKRCITVYIDRSNGEAIGCDKCIREVDAWDWQERNEEENEQ